MTAPSARHETSASDGGELHDFDKSDRALEDRPSISIRFRIGLSMGICFLLTAVVTVAWMLSVREVARSQVSLELVNRYAFELEQARRYEKNFLLYGAAMDDALVHVDTAHRLLSDAKSDIQGAQGAAQFDAVEKNLLAYGWYLEHLAASRRGPVAPELSNPTEIERELRRTGARAVEDASSLTYQQRLRMHTMIRTSEVVAWAGLVIVLLVIAYLANSLARQILRPLGRFVAYTKRISSGDFSPIVPARRFKDEFSDLAVAVNRMLARLKAHEAQLARSSRMAAVGTLTAGIAHELNNPLNNIGLTVEAMLDGFDDYDRAEKVKMLEDVSTQLDRASATVRNLLDFTRVDNPVFVPVSLAAVASEAARLVGNEARLSGVQIALQVPADLCPARGNPRDLQQVFLNLFLNAIQAMPNGGALTVSGACADDGMLRIDVADTGAGIAKEHLASIFDPFFTTKEVGKGTGLGLSVSYGIVQKHEGRLEVTSRVGVGTTFTLWIPCSDSPALQEKTAREPSTPELGSGLGARAATHTSPSST